METNLKKSTIFLLTSIFFVFLCLIAGFKLTFAFEKEKMNSTVLNSDNAIKKTLQKDKIHKDEKIRFPKLMKKVAPLYPEIAKQAQVEGLVILEVTINKKGRVQNVKVIRSIPLLNEAAEEAVKQWIYEPFVIDGKARNVVFIETLEFRLDPISQERVSEEDSVGGVEGGVRGGVISVVEKGSVGGDIEEPPKALIEKLNKPKRLQWIKPEYPEIARQAGVEGTVILQVTIDKKGKVRNLKILRSIPLLDQAAIDAVKQWTYESFMVDGEPKKAAFPVEVTFKLK